VKYRVSAQTWSTLSTDNTVGKFAALALDVTSNTLYAGGSFQNLGPGNAQYVASYNGTWYAYPNVPQIPVTAIYVNSGNIYVGQRTNYSVAQVTKWNGASWTKIADTNEQVDCFAYDSNTNSLFVGGEFTSLNSIPDTNRIARYNGTTWTALQNGTSDDIYTLAFDNTGNNLYAGGYFSVAGSIVVNGVAKWTGTTWVALGSGVGAASVVNALVYDSGLSTLYVAGLFSQLGAVTANNVAKYAGGSWSALGSGTTGVVYNMAYDPGSYGLFLGGIFTGGFLTQWDGSATWGTLPNTASYVTHSVDALAYNPSTTDLYVAVFVDAPCPTCTTIAPITSNANYLQFLYILVVLCVMMIIAF